jgi:hypothetical protein
MFVGPRLLMEREPRYARLQKSFARFFMAISAHYLLVALLVPGSSGGIYFGFILFAAGSVLLNCYYVKYFRMTSRPEMVG